MAKTRGILNDIAFEIRSGLYDRERKHFFIPDWEWFKFCHRNEDKKTMKERYKKTRVIRISSSRRNIPISSILQIARENLPVALSEEICVSVSSCDDQTEFLIHKNFQK